MCSHAEDRVTKPDTPTALATSKNQHIADLSTVWSTACLLHILTAGEHRRPAALNKAAADLGKPLLAVFPDCHSCAVTPPAHCPYSLQLPARISALSLEKKTLHTMYMKNDVTV